MKIREYSGRYCCSAKEGGNRNKIDFDPNELEVLKKMRRLRNAVIHGDTINDINIEEIEKFISIIERLVVSTISNAH